MNVSANYRRLILIGLALLLAVACGRRPSEAPTPVVAPTATNTAVPLSAVEDQLDSTDATNFITIATDAPSRFRDFENIDEFGNVVGFDPDVMATLATEAGFDYEFVVTTFSGLLESVANGEFDTSMSALIIPEQPPDGLAYTVPYLEVGQVVVVRANETEIVSYLDINPGIPIGVQRFTRGEQSAHQVLGVVDSDLRLYDSTPAALQALIDREVEAVVIDSEDAEYFTTTYPQQLKIAGGTGREAWISYTAYGIATASTNEALLASLNEAIDSAKADGRINNLVRTWLVPEATIDAGESLIGTLANELVIGIAGELGSTDPASRDPGLIDWEVQMNTLGGLYIVDAQSQLIPVLAEDFPTISEDGLEYTIRLRSGLTFPDGSELTANDVRFSISRAAGAGNFQVNRYLKDDNGDIFADADAVQVIDPLTVKFVLQAPVSYFPSVLATPPFFVVSASCFPPNLDPSSTCGGIGPYTIVEYDPGVQLRLRANPQWPGTAPVFENIQLRFYEDPARMRRSLENNAIDMAWTGLTIADLLDFRADPAYRTWEGASAFKSYLVFEQGESPWSNARIREAVAHAVDRDLLASEVFSNTRQALYSPVPDSTPGHVATEPVRDLETSRSILTAAGYSAARKLEMTIWFVNDGRYTDREDEYAAALERQLEETGLIEVTLESAPWQIFRPQSLACEYPSYLLGWPSSGQPAAFVDAMSWLDYFITNTDQICSNYESSAMEELREQALAETDPAARLEIYTQIQELWAREYPTLDLTQEPRFAVSKLNVNGFAVDAMGLLHYDLLTKNPATE